MLAVARDGSLFDDPSFADVPGELRRINDIAFSGDGDPTTCPKFGACVRIVAELKKEAQLAETKIVLITNACHLTKPDIAAALAVMDKNNGEIWAKLDAGTEECYQRVNRPNRSLQHVIDSIIATARIRPLVIQTLFMQLDGAGPDPQELGAYVERLGEITRSGGQIDRVQIYTVARRPAEDFVTPLGDGEVDRIADFVRQRTGLHVEEFHGMA